MLFSGFGHFGKKGNMTLLRTITWIIGCIIFLNESKPFHSSAYRFNPTAGLQ